MSEVSNTFSKFLEISSRKISMKNRNLFFFLQVWEKNYKNKNEIKKSKITFFW